MQIKYIMLRGSFGTRTPIVFNDLISHKEVAAGREVLSAGFLSLVPSKNGKLIATPYGESTSLKVAVDPEDAYVLTFMFNSD